MPKSEKSDLTGDPWWRRLLLGLKPFCSWPHSSPPRLCCATTATFWHRYIAGCVWARDQINNIVSGRRTSAPDIIEGQRGVFGAEALSFQHAGRVMEQATVEVHPWPLADCRRHFVLPVQHVHEDACLRSCIYILHAALASTPRILTCLGVASQNILHTCSAPPLGQMLHT